MKLETKGRTLQDADLHKDPGAWGLPANGIAPGISGK
jgi:hypothetical protein